MFMNYRRLFFIGLAIIVLGVDGFLLYKYLTKPAEVTQLPITMPTPQPKMPPTPIVSGPFEPIKLSCAKDDGIRYQEGDFVNDPSVVALDGGGFRLYYDVIPYVIKSAVSSDGNFFTSEGIQKQGLPDTDEVYVGAPSVIKIDDKWIMYYQGSTTKPNNSTKNKIFVAISGKELWEVLED